MINGIKFERTHDFDSIFSDFYTNIGGTQIGIKNLERCIKILKQYYKDDFYYIYSFSKNRFLDNGFSEELDYLVKQGIEVNIKKCCIKFPKKYITDNILDVDLSKLKTYFCKLESCFLDHQLYIDNVNLIYKFKKEYRL